LPTARAARLAAALLLATACRPAAPNASPAAGTAPAAPSASRVVLISFDGVGGERLASLLEEPDKLPYGGFRRIADRGFYARRSRPPTPSLTAVAHVTHVTGALPQATGIVANEMLDPSRPFGTKLSGFDAPIRAETLWQAARRQGKRVGVVCYPGADGRTPDRAADWGINYTGGALSKARFVELPRESWADAPQNVRSFSLPRSARVELSPTAHAVTLIALDTTDDGRQGYDLLEVVPEAGDPTPVRPGDWFAAEAGGEKKRTGSWCKLLALAPDLSDTKLYLGALYANDAYPEMFRRDLDQNVGFWPGPPDLGNAGAHSPHPEIYMEQADRLAAFLTRAQAWAIRRGDWDLLLLYQPEVDEVEHQFFLTDPGQAGYTAERAARFRGYVDQAFTFADRALDAIERALSPSDALFVTSDHGMVPLSTTVYPNEILREAGFLRVSAKGGIDPASAAAAMAGSGIAHVFLNTATAPAGGLQAIERLFAGFRVNGESPFDRIVRRSDAGPIGLDAPESGNLILLARPGVSVSMEVVPGRTSGTPADYGGHGYRNVFPELDATFLAAGPGIARERAEEFPSWRIAARVSRALAIDPPRQASP
jgi:predicted AlkP superfamily pyrophosphatase or phosphodiesterase